MVPRLGCSASSFSRLWYIGWQLCGREWYRLGCIAFSGASASRSKWEWDLLYLGYLASKSAGNGLCSFFGCRTASRSAGYWECNALFLQYKLSENALNVMHDRIADMRRRVVL